MLKLIYKKSAAKGLAKFPKKQRDKMVHKLKVFAGNPKNHQGGWKKMKGAEFWRLRVGGYRAICHIQDGQLVLLVLKIGPRGDVYK